MGKHPHDALDPGDIPPQGAEKVRSVASSNACAAAREAAASRAAKACADHYEFLAEIRRLAGGKAPHLEFPHGKSIRETLQSMLSISHIYAAITTARIGTRAMRDVHDVVRALVVFQAARPTRYERDLVERAIVCIEALFGAPRPVTTNVEPPAHSGVIDSTGIDPTVIDSTGIDPTVIDPEGLDSGGIVPTVIDPEGIDPEGLDPEAIDSEAIDPEVIDPKGIVDSGALQGVIDAAESLQRCRGLEWLQEHIDPIRTVRRLIARR